MKREKAEAAKALQVKKLLGSMEGVSFNGFFPHFTPQVLIIFLVGKPIVVGYHHCRSYPHFDSWKPYCQLFFDGWKW